MSARWLLARHGLTAWGEQRRYLGHADVPLSANGRAQARQLGDRLRGEPVQAAYASDLRRAEETLEIIFERRKARCGALFCPELREVHFGRWEGRTFAEVAPEGSAAAVLRGEMPFPEGESLNDLSERINQFRVRLEAEALARPGETSLVVAHGGSLRVLLCALLGLPAAENWRFQVDPGALTEVVWDAESGARLVLLNDRCHLRERER